MRLPHTFNDICDPSSKPSIHTLIHPLLQSRMTLGVILPAEHVVLAHKFDGGQHHHSRQVEGQS